MGVRTGLAQVALQLVLGGWPSGALRTRTSVSLVVPGTVQTTGAGTSVGRSRAFRNVELGAICPAAVPENT